MTTPKLPVAFLFPGRRNKIMTKRPVGETSSSGFGVRSRLHREGVVGNACSTYSGGGV